MCIIIDANVLPCVFGKENGKHNQYKSVMNWIAKKNGKLVYGGTKYKAELSRLRGVLAVVSQLAVARKTVAVCDEAVNRLESEYATLFSKAKYDDHHLVAIAVVSGCRLVCTEDQGAHELIKKVFCSEKGKRPRCFSGNRGQDRLLVDANIVGCCVDKS